MLATLILVPVALSQSCLDSLSFPTSASRFADSLTLTSRL